MIWLIAGVGLLIAFLLLRAWFTEADPEGLAKTVRFIGAGLLGLAALFFAVTGRFIVAGPAAAGALYLLRAALHGPATQPAGGAHSSPPEEDRPMTVEEARRILGVGPAASPEEISKAHRRLMMKLHPDQGGSDYLASRINQAKDLLLQR